MKFLLSILLLLPFILWLTPKESIAASDNDYFVVTAYYSPLPNQKHYLTWDYESEKKLNGQGLYWASWKSVFSWMIAAPKNYKFWTKIYLEWLGIWEVSDRWWAIVNSWNRWYSYDRLDIWVWYWDEWLQRALYWGKRTVKWYIVDSNKLVTLNHHNIASPNWTTSWLNSKMSVFTYWIWKWSDSIKVERLQEFLNEIWLYNWKIDWIYNSKIIDIVYDFQIKNWILKKGDLYGAWYWGKSTRYVFKKMYLSWEFDNTEEFSTSELEIDLKKEEVNINKKIKEKKIELTSKEKQVLNYPVSLLEDKKELQKIFKDIWTYTWEINWNDKDFISSVYDFQIKYSIVDSQYDLWAWSYWPKTRNELKKIYLELLERREKDRVEKVKLEIEEEKLKMEEKKRKKDLEEKYKIIENNAEEIARKKISKIWNVRFWEVSHSVRELQKTLIELWYLDTKDTAIFWNKTKNAIVDYQLDNNILKTRNSVWAGIVWPKTLSSLKESIKNINIDKYLTKTENKDLLEIVNIEKNEA